MKRLICLMIALLLMISCASAETYYKLSDVQLYILHHSPWGSVEKSVSLTGKIAEVTVSDFFGYIYRVEVDDGVIAYYMGYDKPCFIVVTDDEFHVGNTITVDGVINGLYSSYMVPFITDLSVRLTYPGQP